MEKNGITEYFEEVETKEEYNGYFCRIPEIIWASNDRVSEFLREEFGINHVPCYYWILCMLKIMLCKSGVFVHT